MKKISTLMYRNYFLPLLMLAIIIGSSFSASSQAVFNTFGSGAWSSIGTWNIVSGTDADNIPDADDEVTILDGMNVTVSGGNQQVKDLTLQGTTGTRLNVNGSTLSIFGYLNGPSNNFVNEILRTNSSGLIKFEGGSRTLFYNWSVGSTTAAWLWNLELALDAGTTGTAPTIRASNILFSSGIFSGSEIRVDSTFTDGTGVIAIAKDATVRFSNSIGGRLVYYTPSYCRSITVNGILESTGQGYISGESIKINGRLVNKGYTAIISYPNGGNTKEFIYGPKGTVEYSYANGQVIMGDEINRSPLPNPLIDSIIVNVGSINYKSNLITQSSDTVYANNVRFGEHAKWQITSGAVILSANPKIINASKDHFIATVGGDLSILEVGSTLVTYPIGPSLTEYNPVQIKNNGTPDKIAVKALSARPTCLGPFPLTSMNYQWTLKEGVSGGSDLRISLGYSDITKRGGMYTPNKSHVIHCVSSENDFHNGNGESGADPYYTTGEKFYKDGLFGITSDAGVLPLSGIQSFGASLQNNDVSLTWSVICTAANVKMELQNSTNNADNFSTVYSITADKVRCGSPFNYVHSGAAGNENYYRLVITDLDGSVSYSAIRHLSGKAKALLISLLSNPVKERFAKINIESDHATQFDLTVLDAQGRVMRKMKINAGKGFSQSLLDVQPLLQGLYFIKISENGQVIKTIKMIRD